MSISTIVNSVRYDGNGSTVIDYVIPYPFLDTSHIVAAVSADGVSTPINLNPSDYAVVRNADGQGGTLRTVAAVIPPARITIYRNTPNTQPMELQAAGPFPSQEMETSLDRLAMQIQEVKSLANETAGIGDGSFVQPPAGTPDELINTKIWTNTAERGAVTPSKAGQLGIQFDNQSIWIAQGVATGDWKEYRSRWQLEQRIYAAGVEVPLASLPLFGFVSEDTAIKRIFIASPGGTANEVQVSVIAQLFGGPTTIGTLTITAGNEWAEIAAPFPLFVIPKGTRITLDVQNPSFGTGSRTGLDVILECRNF